MAADHLQHMFSAAYDDALSERQAAQFHEHLRSCTECAASYEVFRTSIDAVRALPSARMPHPVHLPSTAPVAELPGFARIRGLPRLRLLPGAATGVAALAAAAVVVLAISHGGGSTNPSTSALSRPGAAGASTASCVVPVPAAATAPPAQFAHQISAADPGRPGQRLVVATSSSTAAAGSQVVVYAQLSIPVPVAGPANSAITPVASTGAVPCLSLTNGSNTSITAGAVSVPAARSPMADGVAPQNPLNGTSGGQGALAVGADQLMSFTIPPGIPRGTVLHIVASVPANYPLQGDPPLTVELLITVQ